MVSTRASTRRSSPSAAPPPAPSPAGSVLGIDPVSKARTLAHMNADHADDTAAILRHFAGVPADDAAGAELLDLDLAALSIRTASGRVHAVPLRPPMANWADRRARLVAMTLEARSALGLGEGPVHVAYYPPAGVGLVSFAGVMWYFVSAALVFSGNAEPGSGLWRFAEAIWFPGGPETYVWLVRVILVPMLIIHVVEAMYMARGRLAARNVPVGSRVWLLWVANTFFEGVPAWQRWDRKVLGKQKGQ